MSLIDKIQLLTARSTRSVERRNAISYGNASRRGAASPIRYRAKKGSRRVFRFRADGRAKRRATESSDFLIVVGMSLCQRNLSVTGADFERTGRAALKLDDGACREKKERG